MAMTMTQKILASHAGLESVTAGQLIEANLDLTLANDITGPVAIREMEKAGFEHVFDKNKIALVMDHFAPNKDIKSAEQCLTCRNFSGKHEIVNFFDVGQMGIEHALLPEKGLVGPGELIIGADSHTCTYGALGAFSTGVGSTDLAAGMATGKAWFRVPSAIKFNLTGSLPKYVSGKDVILHIIGKIGVDGALYRSMEFAGDGVASLTMDDRLCIANMSIEAGAKNGIFPVDEVTEAYLKGRSQRPWTKYEADPDAEYERTVTIDCDVLQGDGGTRTASVTGGFAALALACRRLVERGDLRRMPIRHYVAGVSAGIVAETPMLDLQYSEDSRAQVDLNCIMNELGEIIEIQGTGEGRAFTLAEQQELVALCAKGCGELLAKQKEILGEIL